MGYAHNWARSGARAQGVDVDGAGTLLVDQIQGFLNDPQAISNADVLSIFIGSNDYGAAVYAFSRQEYPYDQLNLSDMLESVNEGIIAALVNFVASIRERNSTLKIVLITPPGLGCTRRLVGMVEKAKMAIHNAELPVQQKTTLELKVNQSIRSLRLMSSDLTVNIEDLFEDVPGLVIVRTNDTLRRLVRDKQYGNLKLNVNHGGEAFNDAFTADHFHPGSLAHRIIAKKVVSAINRLYAEQVIEPISKSELLGSE